MNAYSLINLLTTACTPDAPFFEGSKLWWVPDDRKPKGGYLLINRVKPTANAIDVSDNENGAFRVGL